MKKILLIGVLFVHVSCAMDVPVVKSKNSTRATIESCCVAGSCYNDQGACCFVQRIAFELQKIKLQLASNAQGDKREKNQKNIKMDFKQLFVVIAD